MKNTRYILEIDVHGQDTIICTCFYFSLNITSVWYQTIHIDRYILA